MRLEPGPVCWGEAGPWQCQHPLAQHSSSPPQLCAPQPAVARFPQPRHPPLPSLSHSVCANSLERRGAGGIWGPAAVGHQGGPCHGHSELSLPKPGLPGGREPSRVRLDHCSALNPQPARAAAGREETESHGGEEVTWAVPQKYLCPLCHLLSRSCLRVMELGRCRVLGSRRKSLGSWWRFGTQPRWCHRFCMIQSLPQLGAWAVGNAGAVCNAGGQWSNTGCLNSSQGLGEWRAGQARGEQTLGHRFVL